MTDLMPLRTAGQQDISVPEMWRRGSECGTIATAMGMRTLMVCQIIQQQVEVPC